MPVKDKYSLNKVRVMVFNPTFNNISAISWRSFLLVLGNRSTRGKCCIEYTSPSVGFELTTLVMIDTDCTDSCKSNYCAITTTMAHY